MNESSEVTRLLIALDADEPGALDELMRAVYADLERIAARHLARAHGPALGGVTLEPAALVNESFLRLIRQREPFRNREQFFALATRVMIRVLKDDQKRRRAQKRGGDARPVTMAIDPADPGGTPSRNLVEIEALETLLAQLEALDPRKARLVELRVVWEYSMPEIAERLGISLATVERDWSFARAWLLRALET